MLLSKIQLPLKANLKVYEELFSRVYSYICHFEEVDNLRDRDAGILSKVIREDAPILQLSIKRNMNQPLSWQAN